MYLVVKALHLIGMVAWFAGLFYMPRLLIYDVEARSKPSSECDVLQAQFRIMARRLWFGITWPAMVFTIFFGLCLANLYGQWSRPWLHVKLSLVGLLVIYHLVTGRLRRQLASGAESWSSIQLRLWNELATLLLIALVLLGSLKELAFHWSVPLSVVAVVFGLTIGVLVYRRLRGSRIEKSTSELYTIKP